MCMPAADKCGQSHISSSQKEKSNTSCNAQRCQNRRSCRTCMGALTKGLNGSGAPVDNAADLSAADRAVLIQPPGLASAKELLRIATTIQQQPPVPLPAVAVLGQSPSDGLGAPRAEGQTDMSWGSKSFLLVWADTAEPVRLTPSVLLAHLILCSRRVSICIAGTSYWTGLHLCSTTLLTRCCAVYSFTASAHVCGSASLT